RYSKRNSSSQAAMLGDRISWQIRQGNGTSFIEKGTISLAQGKSEAESRGRKKAVPTRCTTSPMASASRTALFPRFLCRNEAAGMTGVLASKIYFQFRN